MKTEIGNKADDSTFKIPVIWEMVGVVEINASSLRDAIKFARDLPRPKRGEFLKGTLKVDPEFTSCMK
jgi:hypothetical protein